MASVNVKLPSIDLNDFQRDFRKKFTDPLKKKLKAPEKAPENIKQQVNEIKDILQEEMPTLVWGWITNEERYGFKKGSSKLSGVLGKLTQWAENHGYGKYVPMLIPVIESSVRMIYRGKVESIFEILEIEDDFEKWLGTSISTPAPASTTPTTPATQKEEDKK